jgi:hypothetical protein
MRRIGTVPVVYIVYESNIFCRYNAGQTCKMDENNGL